METPPPPRPTLRSEFLGQLALAGPVALAHLGTMAMGTVDAMMVGRVPGGEGAAALALSAQTIGHVFFFAFGSVALGTLGAIDPLVAQGLGAGDRRAVALAVQRALLLALALSCFVALPLLWIETLLEWTGQPVESRRLAVGYVEALLPGIPFFLVTIVLRQTLQAMHKVRAILIAVLLANIGNVGFNWVLIFGHLGLPAMGVVGSGWATSLSRVLLLVMLWWLARAEIGPLLRQRESGVLSPTAIKRMLRLGLPIGLQNALEFGAFGVVALVMGHLGSREQAAHAIAINLASMSFMLPLGISAAAAVRVGHHVGRGAQTEARRAAGVALAMGAVVMLGSAALFSSMSQPLARLYTGEGAVVLTAATLIPLAGAFQLFDGVQVVALGCLRGVGDTFVPMLINLFGYWAIGAPLGWWLTFRAEVGATGPWWGLVAGLAAVASILAIRVRSRLGRALERIDLDR